MGKLAPTWACYLPKALYCLHEGVLAGWTALHRSIDTECACMKESQMPVDAHFQITLLLARMSHAFVVLLQTDVHSNDSSQANTVKK